MSLATLATVLVSIAFVGLVAWVLWPANKARLQTFASIPFNDEAQPPQTSEQPR